MMLFNLNKCQRCKNEKINVKLTMSNIFPQEICQKIIDCNVLCEKCHAIKTQQNKFITKWTTHLYFRCESKIELQLKWIELKNGKPFTKNAPHYEIDTLRKILENADKPYIHVLKSFAYENGSFHELDIICSLHCKISYKSELIKLYHNLKTKTYLYRRKPYPQNILMKKIFYEYILAMIGDEMYYFEMKDINQYLDDIFD